MLTLILCNVSVWKWYTLWSGSGLLYLSCDVRWGLLKFDDFQEVITWHWFVWFIDCVIRGRCMPTRPTVLIIWLNQVAAYILLYLTSTVVVERSDCYKCWVHTTNISVDKNEISFAIVSIALWGNGSYYRIFQNSYVGFSAVGRSDNVHVQM